jgi:hypothetical protein
MTKINLEAQENQLRVLLSIIFPAREARKKISLRNVAVAAAACSYWTPIPTSPPHTQISDIHSMLEISPTSGHPFYPEDTLYLWTFIPCWRYPLLLNIHSLLKIHFTYGHSFHAGDIPYFWTSIPS